jgi:predicted nuclease of predicted toxin-antitoxin system
MKFLVDAQLPPQLARRLQAAGHDALHVNDLLAADASDSTVVALAAAQGLIVVSKDADFLILAGRRQPPVQFLWVRLGNLGNQALIARIVSALPELVTALANGAPVVELR